MAKGLTEVVVDDSAPAALRARLANRFSLVLHGFAAGFDRCNDLGNGGALGPWLFEQRPAGRRASAGLPGADAARHILDRAAFLKKSLHGGFQLVPNSSFAFDGRIGAGGALSDASFERAVLAGPFCQKSCRLQVNRSSIARLTVVSGCLYLG